MEICRNNRSLRTYQLLCLILIFGPAVSTSVPAFDFRFIDWPSWKVVTLGEQVNLNCATNLLPDSIQWFHNHRPIISDYSLFKVNYLGKNGSSLRIEISKDSNVYKKQEGLYQCVASIGPVSIISLPGHLQISYIKGFPNSSLHKIIEVVENDVLIIPCRKPDSLPESEIIYYKDGEALDINIVNEYFLTDVGDLVIFETNASIQGNYSCAARNSLINQTVYKNSSTEVIIEPVQSQEVFNLPFNFIYKNQSRVIKGGSVKLLCVQHGHVNPTYEWCQKKASSTSMAVVVGQLSSMLEIIVNESILYTCNVKSRGRSTSSNISISIQEPPFLKMAPQNVSVYEGESFRLECSFGGSPIPTISWVFNGDFISGRNFMAFNNEISVTNVSRKQTGIYQCFAFNPSGAAQGTALIQIIPKTVSYPNYNDLISAATKKDRKNLKRNRSKHKKDRAKKNLNKIQLVPSKPNITKLTDESVLVAWNITDETHIVSQILFFKVQFKTAFKNPGQKTKWRTVSETIIPPVNTCEVTGLAVNCYYRFRVAAIYTNNDHKFGPSSDKYFLKKFSRLKRPPNRPQIMSVDPYTNNSVELLWSYVSKVYTDGFIVSYRRTGIFEDYNKVVLLGDKRRRYIVRNIKENTPYDFKLSSFNMAGMSAYSGRKTFLPFHFRMKHPTANRESENVLTPAIVRTDHEFLSTTHLGFALSIGLLILLLIVVSSVLFHSYNKRKNCRNQRMVSKNSYEKERHIQNDQEAPNSPFIDNSQIFPNHSNDVETLRMDTPLK